MPIKRLALLLLLLTLAPTLCACGYSPLERQTFAICMSIDPTEDGKIKLGLQAPKSGQSAEGGVTADYEVLTATGDTVKDALHLVAATSPYPISFAQLRLCLVRYELAATTHLREMIRFLEELPTMRPNATVMIALGDAQAVMEAQKPEFGMRLSTHLNILLQRLQAERLMPVSTLSSCARLIGGGYGDPLLCVCAVNPTVQKQQEKSAGQQGGGGGGGSGGGGSGGSQAAYAEGEPWNVAILPEDMLAGMLPRTSGNPVEYLGSAAVSDGRVSGLLSASQTQLVLRALSDAKRSVLLDGGAMRLELKLKQGTQLHMDAEPLREAVAVLQSLDCDALRFGERAMRAFLTDAEWDAFHFEGQYRAAEVLISAD